MKKFIYLCLLLNIIVTCFAWQSESKNYEQGVEKESNYEYVGYEYATLSPTKRLPTSRQTKKPVIKPTKKPTNKPTKPTKKPSRQPTKRPTRHCPKRRKCPVVKCTFSPTMAPVTFNGTTNSTV